MEIFKNIQILLTYGIKNGLIGIYDEIFARNEILGVLNIDEWKDMEVDNNDIPEYPATVLKNISDYAVENGIIEDTITYRDIFETTIMGKLTARPTEIINKFMDLENKEGGKVATDYFYNFSKKTNYIMVERIKKNLSWNVETEYGELEITINLSKPEKDPRDIAKAKNLSAVSYPKCLLCYENVGYKGRVNHPARTNHRVIPIEMSGENWYLQYSPYLYYNEHCIVFSQEHRDMKISRESFDRLTQFVERFPHYFLGSNADLEIVGGSILTHDHYQGGNHIFPMEKAGLEREIVFKGYEDLECGIVKWLNSVIRIKGENRERVVNLATKILDSWREYSDEKCDIISHTGDILHNTITPIARKRGDKFELDLVLRNNRKSDEYPLGIFHPHSDVHNIKKENIGLIEVMGLAILPARLKEELMILENYLKESGYRELILKDEKVKKHLEWIEELKQKYDIITYEILQKEIGAVFVKVLEYTRVFKKDKNNRDRFENFINYVNCD